MPNRILYEKVTVSETLALLTAEEERFFYRLMVKCDDFGRHHAHPSLLRAGCFPLMLDRITDAMVREWLARLEEVGLVRVYQVDGRAYLEMTTWSRHQRVRAASSKYPAPEIADACQAFADIRARMLPVNGAGERLTGNVNPEAVNGARAAEPPLAPTAAAPPPVNDPGGIDSEKGPPPEGFEPSEENYALGSSLGMDRGQIQRAAAAMLKRYRRPEDWRSDWQSTLAGWLRNAPKFDQPPRASPSSNGHTKQPCSPLSNAPVSYLEVDEDDP